MKVIAAVTVVAPALVACLGNSAARPDVTTPTSPITYSELAANGVTTIATGGTQVVTIADPLAIGLSGETTPAYELVPAAGAWPNAQQGTYTVRALAADTGAFAIDTVRGVAAGDVASADLDHLVVRPAAYLLDGQSAFAVAVDRPAIEAALFDADANRLVDGSLVLAGTGVAQTRWDTATLPATVATYSVTRPPTRRRRRPRASPSSRATTASSPSTTMAAPASTRTRTASRSPR